MDGVNRTLYIPLYGKAYVSRNGLFLHDPDAEAIWAAVQFPLRGKSASRYLAYYMGIRAAVFDDWVRRKTAEMPEAAVLHIGCGLDSRVRRVGTTRGMWYDVDFPEVIRERRRYFTEADSYRMLPGDARQADWLRQIPAGQNAVVVMEGLSMYLKPEELQTLLARLRGHFGKIALMMDCYTPFAARMSRLRNPINDVGVTQVYGVAAPEELQASGLRFVREHDMTPGAMIDRIPGIARRIFRKMYAGNFSKKLYRLYEFEA